MNKTAIPSMRETLPLWHAYLATRSDDARNRLVVANVGLVEATAMTIHARLPKFVDLEELVTYGAFGLIQAVEKFDLDRNCSFATFARPRVFGSIIDELRVLDVPRLARKRQKILLDAIEQHFVENGYRPSDEDLMQTLGWHSLDLQQHQKADRFATGAKSLESLVVTGDHSSVTLGETLVDPRSAEAVEMVVRRDLANTLLGRLPPALAMFFVHYFYHGETMMEIGRRAGYSESRVSQILSREAHFLRSTMLAEAA